MDHKRINKLLKKISSLNESILEDGEFSSIEKEHMLNYIKKLFEEVNGEVPDDIKNAEAPVVAPTPEVVAEVEEEIEEVVEVEEEIQEEVEEEITEVPEIDEALLALFDDESGNELSDKLAKRPIKDLTKAMSINERIFTVNELFGGDSDEFENLMVALNGLSSFDEAKNVLVGSVADKYDWSSKKKIKKASGFIKLVRRRYN